MDDLNSEIIRVLLVEDDLANARLVELALSASSHFAFEIEVVERLSTAIERLRDDSFDVILLDLGLPDSRGLDTISKVHAENQEIPIVVLTGFDDEEMDVLE